MKLQHDWKKLHNLHQKKSTITIHRRYVSNIVKAVVDDKTVGDGAWRQRTVLCDLSPGGVCVVANSHAVESEQSDTVSYTHLTLPTKRIV